MPRWLTTATAQTTMADVDVNLGEFIRDRRVALSLTREELGARSGVSGAHISRIERGERFPSARVLRRLAGPLGLEEDELFRLAGFLPPRVPEDDEEVLAYRADRIDPVVAAMMAQEPVEVQRAAIGILITLKSIARLAESIAETGGTPGAPK